MKKRRIEVNPTEQTHGDPVESIQLQRTLNGVYMNFWSGTDLPLNVHLVEMEIKELIDALQDVVIDLYTRPVDGDEHLSDLDEIDAALA